MKTKRAKIDAEFRFRPDRMKRVLKSERHLAKPEQTKPENCKVRVTICLDADIVEEFKRRASGPMAVPYQTQINHALRECLAKSADNAVRSRTADDSAFIEAVADGVWRRLSGTRRTSI